MPTPEDTISSVLAAPTMDERVARIRLVPENHGTGEHSSIYAAIARDAYVKHLAPDYSYFFEPPFYSAEHFTSVYREAAELTDGFTRCSVDELREVLLRAPRTLLVFRTITGLLKNEFSDATKIMAGLTGNSAAVGATKVDSMEKAGTLADSSQARLLAETLNRLMDGSLFGNPEIPDVKSKQNKIDSVHGWESAAHFASHGVPYSALLHQRHYGGAFIQVSSATGTRRGDLLEDAVEQMYIDHGIQYIRTGAHNQSDIVKKFGLTVTPAPDFVVYDDSGLRAMLECKVVNDGGTARDKALRFRTLRDEALRLGGVPLMAVLGGLGWRRVNDALGPVVRDCEGRVYTASTLSDMLTTFPFPSLVSMSPQSP